MLTTRLQLAKGRVVAKAGQLLPFGFAGQLVHGLERALGECAEVVGIGE
jgi:hypothetical protein